MKFYTILAALALQANCEDMKLVNIKTGFVVVRFIGGSPYFSDRLLEAEMNDRGVIIPKELSSQFNQQEIVFPKDPLFQKAFVEVYYPLSIPTAVYVWANSSTP